MLKVPLLAILSNACTDYGISSRNKAGFGNVFSSFLYILSSVLILEAGFFVFTNFLCTSQTCTVL